jgi:hypothetical protein
VSDKELCAAMSEIDFSTIDHINNDGGRERKALFGKKPLGGVNFYHWLLKEWMPVWAKSFVQIAIARRESTTLAST